MFRMHSKRILFLILLSFPFYLLSSQVPQGFNYQAIARDAAGNPIINYLLPVRITIQSDSLGGTIWWVEEHSSITSNSFGLFTVIIGKGQRQASSASATFGDIDWRVIPKYVKTEINYNGWKTLGSSRLWSVPYAQVSGALSGSLKKLAVRGDFISPDSALFEVRNSTGQTVFAVYNEGVRIYVDDGIAKGATKGGFAIGGFETVKAPSQEFFRVTRDSTRVYVNPLVKGATKGGFAIGGFATVKGSDNNYLDLTPKNYFIGQGAGKSNSTGLYNTFLGYQNGYSNTKGSQNIFLGYHAGYMNDTASYNVFIGNEAGYNNIRGAYNTFIGFQSGQMNTTGGANVFLGQQAGNKIAAGSGNIFLGFMSGLNATTGSHNVILGSLAGSKNAANFNIFLGNYSGYNNTSGGNNLFAGVFSGAMNRKGMSNIYLGIQAGYSDTTGSYNIFQGEGSGFSNQGSNNIMFGFQSGYLSTTGDYNLFVGTMTGAHNTGANNLFLGYQSGYTNTSGSGNVFLGPLSGGYNLSGADNTFIGNQAGYNGSTGSKNIAIGTEAGYNTNGVSNIFLGYQAGYYNSSGIQNTFLGTQAGFKNSAGYNNIFMGVSAGQNNTDGANNVFIGMQTGNRNTLGNLNTSIGYLAGFYNLTGSSNVFLGSQAGFNETGSNRLYIENSTADKNNALIYGEFDTKKLTINGSLGIGKTSPVTKVDITGGNWDVLNGEGDFRIGDGTYRFKIGVANDGGGAGDVRMTSQGGTNRLILGGGGQDILLVTSTNVVPYIDNFSSLGASTNRWTTIYATNGVINTSDARLKTNIHEIGYGLETILKLKPVSFTWKDDSQNVLRLGLIAQDVQKVIGEVVDTGKDPGKTLGINYSEIVPVLIKGMQEQQSQIESVKQENIQLRSTNESLYEHIKILESKVEQIESLLTKSAGK
jgi:hypothetical protein